MDALTNSICLEIDGKQFRWWQEYSIDLSLYEAAGRFSFRTDSIVGGIVPGAECRILDNGVVLLVGVIDTVQSSYGKQDASVQVEGRSLIGLAVDQYVSKFGSFTGKRLGDLVRSMFSTIPLLSRMKVIIMPEAASADVPASITPEPGESVFEFLRRAASARGLLIYSRNDGTVVIGKPITRGQPSHVISVVKNGNSFENRSFVVSGQLRNGIPEHYREIKVFGQGEDDADDESNDYRVQFTALDTTAPLKKTLCRWRGNGASMKDFVRQMIEQQRWNAYQIEYRFVGHSDQFGLWGIDQMCRIRDDVLGVSGDYLIHGVSYQRDKVNGAYTTIRAGLPGVTLD